MKQRQWFLTKTAVALGVCLSAAPRPLQAGGRGGDGTLTALRMALRGIDSADEAARVLKGVLDDDGSGAAALVPLLPADQKLLDDCAKICDEGGFPVAADFFRHFHSCLNPPVDQSALTTKWLPRWLELSDDARELLLPVVVGGFAQGPPGYGAMRARRMCSDTSRVYFDSADHPRPLLELATAAAGFVNDTSFFSYDTLQQIELQVKDTQAAVDLARSFPKHVPDESFACAEAAHFLMTYVSLDEGKQAFEGVLARTVGWRQRQVRMKYYSALRARDALGEQLDAIEEAAKATPEQSRVQLALADGYAVKAKYEAQQLGLRREAASIYAELIQDTDDSEVREAAWVGLSETDSSRAIEVADPIMQEVLHAFAAAGDDKNQRRKSMAEARAFAKCLADALWNALRELETALLAEDKAQIAADLGRQTAKLLALFSEGHPRLHASVRRALTAAHCIGGEHDKALAAYARGLETEHRFRFYAKDDIKDLFTKLALVPGDRGRVDTMPTRKAQWEMGLYFLDHLPMPTAKGITTEPQRTQRTGEKGQGPTATGNSGNAKTQRGKGAEDESKVRSEILDLWAEFLKRTLRAIHGTTYATAANREPEPVDPQAVAEFERIVTGRMAKAPDMAAAARKALRGQRLSHPAVVEVVDGVME